MCAGNGVSSAHISVFSPTSAQTNLDICYEWHFPCAHVGAMAQILHSACGFVQDDKVAAQYDRWIAPLL